MRQVLRVARVALVVLPAIVLALPTSASAQGGSALGFSLAKPFVDGAELLHTAWQISYTRPVGSYGLEVRLPLGMGRPEVGDGAFAIGNPYIGLSMAGSGTMTYFAGVNLPLAPSDADKLVALAAGAASDATDFSGYMPDYLTLSGGVSSTTANATGVSPFWGGAGQFGIYTGDVDAVDGTEILVRGWGGVTYPLETITLNGGAKASYWLTQGDFPGDELELGIFGGGSMAAGPGTLGASLTLPLAGDWGDSTSAVLGLNYSLPL